MSDTPDRLPEEELVQLFRETGDGFLADSPRIVLGAVERGRALRRRRVASVLGGTAALVVLAGGGAVLAGLPGRVDGVRPLDGAASPAGRAPGMTDQEMVAALTSHLGGLRVVDARGTGTVAAAAAGTTPLAELTVDDGNGRRGIRAAVWRDTVRTVLQSTVCERPGHSGITCDRTVLPDGSALMTWTSGYPETGAKSWWCLLAAPSGKRVSITEWNSSEPGGSGGRNDPPLPVRELQMVAADPVWDRAVEDGGGGATARS
ncbi:hypothetical protein [Kitasatospora sp. NPDC085879]|uniref:hypothetical protein n=1 Tax=Kitasatospora sp. NPDC085879 TaxID=3154769 RepID=UPI00343F0AC4